MPAMDEHLEQLDREKLAKIYDLKTRYEAGELSLEAARAELKRMCDKLYSWELAYIEQQFQPFEEDECLKEDVQSMLELYREVLVADEPELPAEHPISHYRQELAALEELLQKIEELAQYPVIKNQWYELYDQLATWKKHLSRKQNQLYPALERAGFDRPTTTMWTLDDFVRDEISRLRALLETDEEAFLAAQAQLVADMRDLSEKEEKVLYPTALELLDEATFADMAEGDLEIGFALIDLKLERKKNKAPDVVEGDLADELLELLARHGRASLPTQKLSVAQGELTLEQINLIYKHLPVDLSYVDENELVCFYSDTKHRVFPRSKNVIGRDVKNCHPRKSVHIVEEIIEKFRSGEQDEVEFWINKPELFIYIKYVAVRDDAGKFRGVLEMMQDCTHIRALSGSRTLLTWEKSEAGETQSEVAPAPKEEAAVTAENLEIGPETKLSDLLAINPQLKDQLISYNDAFKLLKTPLARIMIPKSTVAIMSERTGIDQTELIVKLQEFMGVSEN